MSAVSKIVASGLHPAPTPSLQRNIAGHADAMCAAIKSSVAGCLARIQDAERNAIERLNEYIPTEPLLDSKQAAAYLKMPLRTLHAQTSPGNPQLPFVWIGGLKRFRKVSLDAWLSDNELKIARTKL
jgi:hypothetical protein